MVITLCYIKILLLVVYRIWFLYPALYCSGNNIHAQVDSIEWCSGWFNSIGNQLTVDSYSKIVELTPLCVVAWRVNLSCSGYIKTVLSTFQLISWSVSLWICKSLVMEWLPSPYSSFSLFIWSIFPSFKQGWDCSIPCNIDSSDVGLKYPYIVAILFPPQRYGISNIEVMVLFRLPQLHQ